MTAGAYDHALRLIAYGYQHRQGYQTQEWQPW